MIQLGNAHISVNNPENDPNTGRTNSQLKVRRKHIKESRKSGDGVWEQNRPWFCAVRREQRSWRRGRKRLSYQRAHTGKIVSIIFGFESERGKIS